MKRLAVLAVLALLGLTAYNQWQIVQLRQEIADLQRKVDANSRPSGLSDALTQELMAQLLRARQAIADADPQKARQTLDDARRKLDEASRTAGEKSKPALDWLRRQAADIEANVQAKR